MIFCYGKPSRLRHMLTTLNFMPRENINSIYTTKNTIDPAVRFQRKHPKAKTNNTQSTFTVELHSERQASSCKG